MSPEDEERSVLSTTFDPITGETDESEFITIDEADDIVDNEPQDEPEVQEDQPISRKLQDRDTDSMSEMAHMERDEAVRQSKEYRKIAIESRINQFQVEKSALDNFIKMHETNLEDLKDRLKEAQSVQDFAKASDLTLKISEVNRVLHEADKAKNETEKKLDEAKATPVDEPQPASKGIPVAARIWSKGKEVLVDSKVYSALPAEKRAHLFKVRQAMATTLQELVQEGYKSEDPSMYEELDLRLSETFPAYKQLLQGGIDAVGKVEPKRKQINVPAKGPSVSGPIVNQKRVKTLTYSMLSETDKGFYDRHYAVKGISKQDFLREFQQSNPDYVKELLKN